MTEFKKNLNELIMFIVLTGIGYFIGTKGYLDFLISMDIILLSILLIGSLFMKGGKNGNKRNTTE